MLKREIYEEVYKGWVVYNENKLRFENEVELIRYRIQVLEQQLKNVFVIFDIEPEYTNIEIDLNGDLTDSISNPVNDIYVEYCRLRRIRNEKT